MATLDKARVYHTWSGLPECVGFHDHQPVTKSGKVIPDSQRVTVHLQDGLFFGEDGEELDEKEVPKEVRAWRGSLKRFPGITEKAKVIECPSCHLRFPVRRWFERHLRAHGLNEEQMAEVLRQLDAGEERLSVEFDESDFAPAETVQPVAEPVTEGLPAE